jgi:hypothetical protein
MDSNTKAFLIGLSSSIAAGFVVYLFLKDNGSGKVQSSAEVKQSRFDTINKPLFTFSNG